MTESLDRARKTKISFDEWVLKLRKPGYRYMGTEWYRAGKALEAEAKQLAPVPVPPKPPSPDAPFGTTADAGLYAGRGIMLGGNPDVWDQAIALARDGWVDVVAVIPGTPWAQFPCRVVTWVPPELEPAPGHIHQAENSTEWRAATVRDPAAICLNSWEYGRFPVGTVALVEAYYNEGWGLNFEEFRNYMTQGAKAVIPLCGGYSAAGRSDVEAARIYASLATWSGEWFPGFWMFAGESYLTPESVAALKAWTPRD